MTCLYLTFEIRPNSCVEDVAQHLCAMADKLNCCCEARFNGVTFVAWPGTDPALAAVMWAGMLHVKQPDHLPPLMIVSPGAGAKPIVEQNDWAGDDDRSIGMMSGDVE